MIPRIKSCIWWTLFLSISISSTSFGLSSKIALITIPKTGTHLVEKCATLLYTSAKDQKTWGEERVYMDKINHLIYFDDLIAYFGDLEKKYETIEHLLVKGHIFFDQRLADELVKRDYKVILNVRDPRDQIISNVYWVEKLFPEAIKKSHDELISMFSTLVPHSIGVDGYNTLFMPWLNYPNVLLVKFENLVGPRGGGSYDKQREEIKRIATHIGLIVSPEIIERIANELFGSTETFRQGKIGAWKTEFTQEHKKLFKSLPGAQQLLMQLGYEKNENW